MSSVGNGFNGFTISYLTIRLTMLLENKGVKIEKKPQKVFWDGLYVFDPDWNLWEIAFNPYLK